MILLFPLVCSLLALYDKVNVVHFAVTEPQAVGDNNTPQPANGMRVKEPAIRQQFGGIVKRNKKPYALRLSTMKVPTYSKDFRNPCWYEGSKASRELLCLPYFYIAGFHKSATTDLYGSLIRHPLITPGFKKEPLYITKHAFRTPETTDCNSQIHCKTYFYAKTWFMNASFAIQLARADGNLRKFKAKATFGVWTKAKMALIEKFPNETLAIWKKGGKRYKYPMIAVDGSAGVASDFKNWRAIADNEGLEGPEYITADWIKKIYPDARIIMILREPAARTFSDYNFFKSNDSISLGDFHEHAKRGVEDLKSCLSTDTHPHVCFSKSKYTKLVGRSFYYTQVKMWLDRFPRNHLLILRSEDYQNKRGEVLEQMFKFLELPLLSREAMDYISDRRHANISKNKLREMWPETRQLLTNFFVEHNEKLAKLLGDDRFLWKDV